MPYLLVNFFPVPLAEVYRISLLGCGEWKVIESFPSHVGGLNFTRDPAPCSKHFLSPRSSKLVLCHCSFVFVPFSNFIPTNNVCLCSLLAHIPILSRGKKSLFSNHLFRWHGGSLRIGLWELRFSSSSRARFFPLSFIFCLFFGCHKKIDRSSSMACSFSWSCW